VNPFMTYVKSVASKVRHWVECEDNRRDSPTNDLNGWCAIASAQLSRELNRENIKHKICVANDGWGSHVFVMVEDHVVDVTATQFHPFRKSSVLLVHHKEVSDLEYYRIDMTFDSADELRKWQKKVKWPAGQIAYTH